MISSKILKKEIKIGKVIREDDEYKVLYAYLQFPQRYWRLANRYYYNEVNWGQNTFSNKIESIINEQEKFIKFLDDFKKEYSKISDAYEMAKNIGNREDSFMRKVQRECFGFRQFSCQNSTAYNASSV